MYANAQQDQRQLGAQTSLERGTQRVARVQVCVEARRALCFHVEVIGGDDDRPEASIIYRSSFSSVRSASGSGIIYNVRQYNRNEAAVDMVTGTPSCMR